MSGVSGQKRKGMSFRGKALLWTILSLIFGAAGGFLGQAILEAPFYFGFFFGWVLTGLIGMFILAVHVAENP